MKAINGAFHELLKNRGLNLNKLAELTQTGRSHLSQVIAGRNGRGLRTRRKLFMFLTVPEIMALGWSAEYADWVAEGEIRRKKKEALTAPVEHVEVGASQTVSV